NIVGTVDSFGAQTDFVSVTDVPRATFAKHPWSIGGGGAAELKEQLDEQSEQTLGDIAESIGITCFTLEDDVYIIPRAVARRRGIQNQHLRVMQLGDTIRDYLAEECDPAVF